MTILNTNSVASCIMIMGVSGSGKSTIGQQLAKQLNVGFIDGDNLHPATNIAKMTRGEALTDTDRLPWLRSVAAEAQNNLDQGQSVVIVCSALKCQYRDIFRANISAIRFIFLDGSYTLIEERMTKRKDHFMRPDMLKSQFSTLERPERWETDILTISITQTIDSIIRQIIAELGVITKPVTARQ